MDEAASNELPVVETLVAAILAPIALSSRVVWFAIPLLIVSFVSIAFNAYSPIGPTGSPDFFLRELLFGLASYAAALTLAVACHRMYILGEESMAGSPFIWWTSRETRFLGWGIALGFIAVVVSVPAVLIVSVFVSPEAMTPTNPAVFLLLLPAVYVVSRLSLVLPATATDGRPSLGWAWDLSKGNGVQLLLVVGIVPFVLQIAFGSLPIVDSVVYDIFLALVWIYVIAFEVAALSLSYKALSGGSTQEDLQ